VVVALVVAELAAAAVLAVVTVVRPRPVKQVAVAAV
jgi:hypothetical protein